MADIEVAVRSAANNSARVLDIKHRVPFDEAARALIELDSKKSLTRRRTFVRRFWPLPLLEEAS